MELFTWGEPNSGRARVAQKIHNMHITVSVYEIDTERHIRRGSSERY